MSNEKTRTQIIFEEQIIVKDDPAEKIRQQNQTSWQNTAADADAADGTSAQLREQIVFDPEAQNNFQSQTSDQETIDVAPVFVVFTHNKHWPLLGRILLALCAAIFGIETAQFIYGAWQTEPGMATLYTAALALLISLCLRLVINEYQHLRQLKQLQRWHKSSQHIEQGEKRSGAFDLCEEMGQTLPKDPDTEIAIARWRESIKDNFNDREILELYSATVLQKIDDKASKVITRYASETALMVAISPMAVMDMALVLWRSVRMINEISQLYGMQLGYLSRIRLLRIVASNVLYAGTSELIADTAAAALSLEIAGKLSLNAAQGVGAGLLTGRLGFKTIQCCRAIPAPPDKQKRLGDLSKLLLKDITFSLTRRKA